MPEPGRSLPIGLRLTRTARMVSQAFDRSMEAAGGSRPASQVLLLIRSQGSETGTRARTPPPDAP